MPQKLPQTQLPYFDQWKKPGNRELIDEIQPVGMAGAMGFHCMGQWPAITITMCSLAGHSINHQRPLSPYKTIEQSIELRIVLTKDGTQKYRSAVSLLSEIYRLSLCCPYGDQFTGFAKAKLPTVYSPIAEHCPRWLCEYPEMNNIIAVLPLQYSLSRAEFAPILPRKSFRLGKNGFPGL